MIPSLRLFVLLIACVAMAQAEEVYPRPEFLVRTWQSDEGLPGNVVRSVGQTADGLLWIATAEGLARFDGFEFESIPSTGEWRGRALDLYRVFTPEDGSVWVATNRYGLFHVGAEGLEAVIEDYVGPSAGIITRLFTSGGETYFIRDQHLWRLNHRTPEAVTEVSADLARAMAADLSVQRQRGRMDDTRSPARLVDHDGGAWTVEERGIEFVPPGGAYHPVTAVALGGIVEPTDMLEDREGNLWIASPLRGLIRIRHSRVTRFAHRDGIYATTTRTVIQARDGTWWISKRSGGVDRIRNGELLHIPIVTNGITRTVSSMHEDRSGRLWIASREGSVFTYNPDTERVEGQFMDTPEMSKISVIAEDTDGRLWFGGRSRLFRWDGTTLKNFKDQPLLLESEISTMAFDSRGKLCIGTMNGKILTFDGTTLSLLGDVGPFPRRSISTLLPLSPDELWASSLGAGLLLWKNGSWHRFGARQGLPDERLTAMTLVGDDALWMGSLGGILRVSRAELLQSISDESITPSWEHLDRSDGLPTRECVGWCQPGVFPDKEGRLWFPTTGGLAGVMTENFEESRIPPLIRFHSVEVHGVPQAVGSGPVIAGPGKVRLGFHFSGLSLTAPEKVTYRVRLVGLEEEPRFIGSVREVEYQFVPPGHYTFEVSATNGDGVTTELPATLAIEILPYFWQRGWFVALTAIVALLIPLLIGWIIARARMKIKIRQLHLQGLLETERARISRDLHDDLGASLTEVSILSELTAEDNHDEALRPALDQLSVKAKRVVGALDEIVWATNPTQDSLSSLVEYLSFFARDFLKAVHVPLQTEVVRNIPDLPIGPRRRHNVVLATREALNNSVKHANATSTVLRITIEEGNLVVVIEDNGKGFALEYEASGDGLTNMAKRMKDCGGDCRIESRRGRGTTVTLLVPLTR